MAETPVFPAPASPKESDPWVFREGRVVVSGKRLSEELGASILELVSKPFDRDKALSILLRSGELETALADIGWVHLQAATRLTDSVASTMWPDSESIPKVQACARALLRSEFPEHLSVSPAEGFAYYALHPLEFVNLALALAPDLENAAVIGIRSIGTTLSALVTAALRAKGRNADRITLRPTGHPYERTTQLSAAQLRWVEGHRSRGARFLVVDEGPGRSGSSFLSVGEALVMAGVSPHQIIFLGSRQVDPRELCARDAVPRWSQFRFLSPAKTFDQRFGGCRYLGAGDWRPLFLGDRCAWPPTWPQMERLKFLSPDNRWIFKFEGFGHYGEQVLDRARRLEAAGFGCKAADAGDGFLSYPVVRGRPARRSDLGIDWLERLAEYCAFRAKEFPVRAGNAAELSEMLISNLTQEFGERAASAVNTELLAAGSSVLTDGRMQPHEWVQSADGRVFKTDGCSHGDDHFFPGPTDPAWDLAGAIVEWNMDRAGANFLLARFHRFTGDDASRRLPIFQLAYTTFRLAYCRMALSTVGKSADEQLLTNAYRLYRRMAEGQLARLQPSSPAKDRLYSRPHSVSSFEGKSKRA